MRMERGVGATDADIVAAGWEVEGVGDFGEDSQSFVVNSFFS